MNAASLKNRDSYPAWIAAAALFVIHAAGNAHYGFFRDELYFIICGMHPQWGYVDQPPIVPLLSAGTQVFGHSLFALRLIPALFAAAGAFTMCRLAVQFGGGVFAQSFATTAFAFTLVLMSFGMKVSTDTVGLWTWPLLALLLARIAQGQNPRLWLLAGLVAGVTLESKYSILFFLAALLIGLLLTPQRRMLASPWCAAGCAIAIAIALPNVIWQWRAGLPMLELLRNGQDGKNLVAGPLLYLFQEILITNLFLWPVWVAGLFQLLRSASYRFLGLAYVVLIAEMIVFHGKHYYPGDVYPILLAAGGVAVETWTAGRAAIRVAAFAYAVLFGAMFVPLALPVLSEDAFVQYQTTLGSVFHISRSATATEHGRESSALPGDWADMHGWPEMASTVARVYDSLPPAERAQAVVFAGNYGEASAVAFFEPRIPVISGHNQYWLWGTRGYTGNVVIEVNGSCSGRIFASHTLAATFENRWSIGYENHLPIYVCRGIRKPIGELWPAAKRYI